MNMCYVAYVRIQHNGTEKELVTCNPRDDLV